MKSHYPEVTIGSLASPEPGAFKIGPFGSSLKKGELVPEGIPVVGIENVLPNNFVPEYRKFITHEKFGQLSQYKMEPFDVVVTTMGTIGRAAVVPENIETAIIDSHLFRMRVDPRKVDPAYLCYALNGYPPLIRQLQEKAVGAIMAGLNTKILRECTIPLPPLPEQQRIVARLNEQMLAVAQARRSAEEQLQAARALSSAYFRKVFTGTGEVLPTGWRWTKLGDVIDETQPGFASGQRDPKGVIQLRMNNVDTRGNLVWDEFLRVPADVTTIEKYCLKPGDIVFNNTNSTELVGKSALFMEYDEVVVYSNHFTRLRVKPELADPGLITFWLISQWQMRTFEKICNRWIGQSAVKNDKLFELEIPLPPKFEQQNIAVQLNEQMAVIAQVRRAAEEQLAEINRLPSTLLREAFNVILSVKEINTKSLI